MLPPLLGPETLVIPLQNGVDSVDVLSKAIGRRHVAGGTCYVSALIAEPGFIRHVAMGRLVFGPVIAAQREPLERLLEVCRRAPFDTTMSDRIHVEIWAKFARLTVFSGMTSITRCPMGVLMRDPDLRALMEAGLRESIAVARARQVPLASSLFHEVMKSWDETPPQTKSSMLEDLERGRPLELPWLSGAVVRIGEEVGVHTPTHRLITTLLKPHAQGRP
jgi:2-dehydropantoate 2-reductase